MSLLGALNGIAVLGKEDEETKVPEILPSESSASILGIDRLSLLWIACRCLLVLIP